MTASASQPLQDREPPSSFDALRAGDPAAFRQFYERYQSAVLAVAYSVAGNWTAAEDICQEVFLKVHQRLEQFQPGTSFKAWLLTIARNTAIDALRRGRRETELPDGLAAEPGPDPDARRTFIELLAPLKPDERLVVTLRYHEDLPYHDIARVTGLAGGSLRNMVSNALRKLRLAAGGKR